MESNVRIEPVDSCSVACTAHVAEAMTSVSRLSTTECTPQNKQPEASAQTQDSNMDALPLLQNEQLASEPEVTAQTQDNYSSTISDTYTLPLLQNEEQTPVLVDSGQTSAEVISKYPYGTIVVDPSQLQYFTIAEDVIIEAIDLADDGSVIADKVDEINPSRGTKRKKYDPMENWDDSEKYMLLNIIKSVGIDDLEQISAAVPSKSFDEVKEAIDHYRDLAASLRVSSAKDLLNSRRRAVRHQPDDNPLANWLQGLVRIFGMETLHTETSRALQLIAEFESLPCPEDTCNVDFRTLYRLQAAAMESQELPDISEESREILRRMLTETSLLIDHLGKSGFNDHIKDVNLSNGSLPGVGRGTSNICQLKNILEKLISKRAYNPLGIPFKLLDINNLIVRDTEG